MPVQNPTCIEHEVRDPILVVTILEDQIRKQETVNQIKEAMTEAVESSKCKSLIIDMGKVKFIGSIGFLAFLAMRRVPGVEHVVLCNLADHVKEMFLICRLIPNDHSGSAPFHECSTVAAAIKYLNTGTSESSRPD